jgi:type II secretory pathway component PulF
MEQDIQKKLEEQDEKLNAIFLSIEKVRKYFLIIVWVAIIIVVLPAIGLFYAIPKFSSTYTNLEGLL